MILTSLYPFLTHENAEIREACKQAIKLKSSYPYIYGDLNLYDTITTRLPSNLRVQGSLILRFSNIEELPPGLSIYGNLDLSHTLVKILPEDLFVGKNLNLTFSNVSKFPKEFSVLGTIFTFGSFISQEEIDLLPPGFEIEQGVN